MNRATTTIPVLVGQDYSALRVLNDARISGGEPVLVTVGSTVLEAPTASGGGRLKGAFCSSELFRVPGVDYNPSAHSTFRQTAAFQGNRVPFLKDAKRGTGGIYVFLGHVIRGADERALFDTAAASFLPLPDFDTNEYEYAEGCERGLEFHLARHSNRLKRAGAKVGADDFLELLGELMQVDGHVIVPAAPGLVVGGREVELRNRRMAKLFAAAT